MNASRSTQNKIPCACDKDENIKTSCRGSLHFSLLSARHVVRAALPAFPRLLMRSPAFPALCDALYSLFRLNAALGHSLGLGITP